jgi:hypothetical protein
MLLYLACPQGIKTLRFADGFTKWEGVIMADAATPSWGRPDNSEDQMKGALHALVEEAIKDARGRGQQIDHHRHHSPYSDTEYDEQFIRLNAFMDALHHIEVLSEVHQSYGVDAAQRMVLQFLNAYLNDVPDLALDEQCFESIWSRFRRELSIAEWRHIGITLLQNFRSPLGRIAHIGVTVATECLSEHMTALKEFFYQLVTITLRLVAEVLGLGLFGEHQVMA